MSEDLTLVVRVQNTPEDLAHFQQNIGDAASNRRGMAVVAIPALLAAFVAFVLGPSWLAQFALNYQLAVIISIAVLGLAFALTFKIYTYVSTLSPADPSALVFTPQDFIFSPQGVTIRSPHAASELSWRAFLKAKETASHYFLYMDPGFAYLVPKRAFASNAEAAEFAVLLRRHIELSSPVAR